MTSRGAKDESAGRELRKAKAPIYFVAIGNLLTWMREEELVTPGYTLG